MSPPVPVDVALVNQTSALGIEREAAVTATLNHDGSGRPAGRNLEIGSDDVSALRYPRCGSGRNWLLPGTVSKRSFAIGDEGHIIAQRLQRIGLVALRFRSEQRFQFLDLVRILGRKIMCLTEVLVEVVKLPGLGFWRRIERRFICRPGNVIERAGPPAVFINATAAEHFEILQLVSARSIGVIEGVSEAHTFERRLLDSIHFSRRRDGGQLVDGGRNIVDVGELVAYSAGLWNVTGPGNDERITRAAQVRSNFLGPLKGRVERPSPCRSEVIEEKLAAQIVDLFQSFCHA